MNRKYAAIFLSMVLLALSAAGSGCAAGEKTEEGAGNAVEVLEDIPEFTAYAVKADGPYLHRKMPESAVMISPTNGSRKLMKRFPALYAGETALLTENAATTSSIRMNCAG